MITVDWIVFALFAIPTAYLLFFSIFSKVKIKKETGGYEPVNRIAVFIPAYKEDDIIEDTLESAIGQNYPKDEFTVVLIADKFRPETISRLSILPVRILPVDFVKSTKAGALNFAVAAMGSEKFDIAVVIDADNIILPEFLSDINRKYNAGSRAIQAHRVAKNMNTPVAILDAASEEINNSIFRKGHVAAGFPSALIGSGMAFDYAWFAENVHFLETAGEDKELEILLLQQRIFVDYLPDTVVYDEKTKNSGGFYNQRRRWLAAQLGSFSIALRGFPKAVASKNWPFCDKLFQWMMPPRVILLGLIAIIAIVVLCISPLLSIKWFALAVSLILSLFLALPVKMLNGSLMNALIRLPWIFCLMFADYFRVKGARKSFIHTDHSH